MQWLSELLDLVLPPRRGERLVRAATSETVGSIVRPELIPSKPFATIGLIPYAHPLAASLIKELKFHRSEKALMLLSGILADYLTEHLADDAALQSRNYVLVPVPLSLLRVKRRGYNQVELLCREAAKQLPGVAVETTLLSRVRDTAPQTKLQGSKRRENMQGAFAALRQADPAHTYILVDDVTTTGATLHAAMQALTDAGATSVSAVALAY